MRVIETYIIENSGSSYSMKDLLYKAEYKPNQYCWFMTFTGGDGKSELLYVKDDEAQNLINSTLKNQ